mmetsp:Transcript_27686/g.43221  ORF Transcript_27686/g.43221 Transcript_27686/m.43221 type:complete len:110 (+) Transcript_27686:1643-1972(+)
MDLLDSGEEADAMELCKDVEVVKLKCISLALTTQEESYMRLTALYAAGRDVPNTIPEDRRQILNGALGKVQSVAVRITQQRFYKDQAEEIMNELSRRESGAAGGRRQMQ